jgi:hypothetical protein
MSIRPSRSPHPPVATVRERRTVRLFAVFAPGLRIVYFGPDEGQALLALANHGLYRCHLWSADPGGDWRYVRTVPPARSQRGAIPRPEEA